MIYDPPVQPENIVGLTKWMSDEMLETITPQLLNERPNTYTFAKALAESQLQEDAQGLPVIVIRPSIIGAVWKDNLPGIWLDEYFNPSQSQHSEIITNILALKRIVVVQNLDWAGMRWDKFVAILQIRTVQSI